MKQQLMMMTILLASITSFGQSEKYVKAMEQLVPAVDTTRSIDGLTNLANSFQRIADAEKTQWLPYYYAAYANLSQANMMFVAGKTDQIDALADKAEPLLVKAEALKKDNPETFILRKILNSARMMVDPPNRYQTYGGEATAALEKAKSLDPENPRVFLLEGQDLYFTPEQFGGDKAAAKKKFETAIQKFDAAKPASKIDPTWGKSQAAYFLSLGN